MLKQFQALSFLAMYTYSECANYYTRMLKFLQVKEEYRMAAQNIK